MILRRLLFTALSISATVLADLVGVPTLPYTCTDGNSSLDLHQITRIIIDNNYANATDTDGQTLIPPTLSEFAKIFSEDWSDIVGTNVSVEARHEACSRSIFLTLGNSSDFKDAAGRWTSEAYAMEVDGNGVKITGASPLGVWWGTRSLLQQAAMSDGKMSTGHGVDSPGWGTRGIFLDAGRHYYPPSFLIELCSWISFCKQNTFHLHLSDNLYNNVDIYSIERQLDLYAAFRLWSDDPSVAGLNKRQNESYTREDFDHIQSSCAARGVTIIPEIEAPGHALVISQWKQSLGLDGQLDLLNISNPSTIPTMQSLWSTFLPWFHSKTVHIGADEYTGEGLSTSELAFEYNTFVNALNSYIHEESDKNIRIWGTYPPQANYTNNISTNVSIQHWEFFEDNPYFDYIKNNYSVMNSDDAFYIVQKYSTSYPQVLNATRIFHGSPDGSAFAPNIFDQTNATNNPPRDNPYVLGHIAAQWNDYGPNTSTYMEAYYSWRDWLPALADKQWGGRVTEEEYGRVFDVLQAAAPGQNLDRRVKAKTSTILEYDFSSNGTKDLSRNGYHARTNCSFLSTALILKHDCSLTTPLKSKGFDYTLSFTMKKTTSTLGPIFSGPDSALYSGNGTSSQLMLISAGNAFALNYSLPVGEWVNASLIGRGNQTYFQVNGGKEMEFLTKVGVNGESFAWARMAVVAPLETIGGGAWEAEVKRVKLVDHA